MIFPPAWQVHTNAVFDLEWLQQEEKILTGSGDQTIALHDIETCTKLDTFRGHSSSIKSISSHTSNDGKLICLNKPNFIYPQYLFKCIVSNERV